MKLISWNVNSLKARLDHVLRYLEEQKPDVLMLQELKGLEFPQAAFEAAGYQAHAVCQKTYNGVAIIAKQPFKVIHEALPGDPSDEQARYLEIEMGGLRVIDIYLPNGNPVDSEKFPYKLAWVARLKNRLAQLRAESFPFVIGGDFNIIPEDKDCYDPKTWRADALFHPKSLNAFRALINLGLTDAFRVQDHRAGQYSFWDYQRGAWQKGEGIRIDHFLLSPEITDRLKSCIIDSKPRGWERPSDHTPIILEIEPLSR